jgi:hypothetical protein
MILEEIEGNVKVTFAGKTLSVGDSADDYSRSVSVIGTGKAIFRIDPSATFEVKGVKAAAEEVPAPTPTPKVQAAPIAERVTPPVEPASKTAEA